jgi:hypothetical protein
MKPKILICVLTGTERGHWINPDLSRNLFSMFRDTRFDVNYYPVCDCRPWEAARNMSIVAARQINADWLISFDNDNFLTCNPLDIVAEAGKEQHVIGLPYGIGNREAYRIYPNENHGQACGPFREEESVGGGVLIVRNRVWQTIKTGPWFRWEHAETETLMPAPGTCGEDIYFCRLVRRHGLKIWSFPDRHAGHYKSTDITEMIRTSMKG